MTKAKENHRGQCRQGWVRTKPRFCISPASCRSTGSPCRSAPGVPTITLVIILITIRDTFLCRSMSRNYSCQSPAHWRSCQTFCQKCLHFVSPEMKTSQIFLSGKNKKLGETGSFFQPKREKWQNWTRPAQDRDRQQPRPPRSGRRGQIVPFCEDLQKKWLVEG